MIAGMERSILVVDDDPAFRELVQRILAEAGLKVVAEADSAAAAISAAKAMKPEAALVDVDLPDRGGIALAQELAALPWRPRVAAARSLSSPRPSWQTERFAACWPPIRGCRGSGLVLFHV
jgi:CheY-like chemotaxis protein